MTLDKWQQIRKKGKTRFIWQNIVLSRAIVIAVLYSLLVELSEPSNNLFFRLIISIIIFSLVGIVVGHNIWENSEEEYAKSNDRQNT